MAGQHEQSVSSHLISLQMWSASVGEVLNEPLRDNTDLLFAVFFSFTFLPHRMCGAKKEKLSLLFWLLQTAGAPDLVLLVYRWFESTSL